MPGPGKSSGWPTELLRVPYYPVLIALYLPVWHLWNSSDLFDVSDAIRSLVASVLIILPLLFLVGFLYRDRHKAALLTSFGILFFYSFSTVSSTILANFSAFWTGILSIVCMICLGWLIGRWRRNGSTSTLVLNGFALVLFIQPASSLIASEIEKENRRESLISGYPRPEAPVSEAPNVVHIVLDGYSRADVLAQIYGYDNSDFLQSLRKMDFVVTDKAVTPYNRTLFSMNSVFSMRYINDHVEKLSATTSPKQFRVELHWDFQDSAVLRSLRSKGYSIVEVEGPYSGVRLVDSDMTISTSEEAVGVSHFEATLFRRTPLRELLKRVPLANDTHIKTKFALGNLDFGMIEPPFFVYNHVIAPHPPFNITADGSFRPDLYGLADGNHRETDDDTRRAKYRAGYVEKLKFTNRAILAKLEHLRSRIPDPKIIILHGDHGGGLYLDQSSKSNTCLKERFSTLLAVYSSDQRLLDAFEGEANLVNLYRTILTRVFNEKHAPLESRSYYSTWSRPAELQSVEFDELNTFGPACAQFSELPNRTPERDAAKRDKAVPVELSTHR